MFALQSVATLVALLLSRSSAPQGTIDPDYVSCHLKAWPPSGCDAVRWNLAGDFQGAEGNPCGLYGGGHDPIQFVTLGAPGAGRIYVAFSTTIDPVTGDRTNNVLMTVLELACGESADILVFGTGYGCRQFNQTVAEFGPEHDAELINDIVRECMGLLGTLKVAFVVPHGHPDHINPEFIYALENLGGYTVDKIYVHADDSGYLAQAGMACPGAMTPSPCYEFCEDNNCIGINFECWDIGTFGQIDCCDGNPFPPNCSLPPEELDCETAWNAFGVLSFRSTVGRVWFRGRDGHTAGSVDLVLDHQGGTANRFVIYGSQVPGCPANNCINLTGETPTPGCPPDKALVNLQWVIPAHGNIPRELTTTPACPLPCTQ